MALYALDLETTGLDPFRHRIVSASICGTDLKPESRNWTPTWRDKLYSIVANRDNTVLIQNSVFDLAHLIRNRFKINCKIADSMIGAHILQPSEKADLGSIVKRYLWPVRNDLGIVVDWNWKDKVKQYMKERNRSFRRQHGRSMGMQDIPETLRNHYGRCDALYLMLVWQAIKIQLKTEHLWKVYQLDIDTVPIVLGMFSNGISLDSEYCRKRIKELRAKNRAVAKRFHGTNLGSPKQIYEKVFPKLGITPRYKTVKGTPKTDEQTLLRYARENRKIMEIIDYRKSVKDISSYFGAYLKLVHCGKIHPTFRIAAAKTGRLSCADPNLQQMKRVGKGIRTAFIPRPGYLIFRWDYNQIEMRLIACKSRDPKLLKIFRSGGDVHVATAKSMHLYSDEMKETLRGQDPRFVAKQLNYKLWYGMGANAISLELLLPVYTVRALVESYWKTYSWGHSFFELISQRATAQGYVRDEFGRIYVPDGPYSGYKCVNYLIQGSASSIMKIGMKRSAPLLIEPDARLLLTVHDEIDVEVRDDPNVYVPLIPKVTKALSEFTGYEVPITVECSFTRTNLEDLHPLTQLKGFENVK